jgi:hypothetical protein
VQFVRGEVRRTATVLGTACMPVRTALFDAMRLRDDVRDAVVDLDMTAAARLTTVGGMTGFVEGRHSWRGVPGVPLVRQALRLASDHSASPPETRLRLVWLLDAGLPPPLVNQPVYERHGRLLGYPDLLDVEAGLVVEYDGDDHRSAARHSDDVDREARFRRAGLEVTRITGRDLWNPLAVVERLREARGRARWDPPERRSWLTAPW